MRNRPLAALAALGLALGSLALGSATPAAAAAGVFADTPTTAETPIVVDGTTETRTIPVALDGTITDIDVTLDFWKVGDWCSNPSGFLGWNNEIRFDLLSPSGTRVTLIKSGDLSDDPDENDPDITYPSYWESERVEVVLDDQASTEVGHPERADPDDHYPESGTFHTAGRVLDGLDGETAAGEWILEITDELWGDELCYYGASLEIETEDVVPAPALTGGPLPAGAVGANYSVDLPGSSAGPIGSYAVVDAAELPPGLTLKAATGEISGIPTAKGSYSFDVTATGPGGTSAPATFSIVVIPGAVHALAITPATATVERGDSLEFTVTATDLEGNPVDITGEYALNSSGPTDIVAGRRVSFPTASPHTITATHLPTGLTASALIRVLPGTERLAATGSSGAQAALLGLGLLALGGLLTILPRSTRS